MNLTTFFPRLLLSFCLCCAAVAAEAKTPAKPNILIILADGLAASPERPALLGRAASERAPDPPAVLGNRLSADGVLLPRRPVAEAIAEAMRFLKKADGGYVPGRIDGDLAGYFTSAHVNPDGTRSGRKLSFPARQHAYFIFTFLRYYAYTGELEWLSRARDLADWNLAHSTPAQALYSNLPYSTMLDGKPGGSRDQDSIEPDKAAFALTAAAAMALPPLRPLSAKNGTPKEFPARASFDSAAPTKPTGKPRISAGRSETSFNMSRR